MLVTAMCQAAAIHWEATQADPQVASVISFSARMGHKNHQLILFLKWRHAKKGLNYMKLKNGRMVHSESPYKKHIAKKKISLRAKGKYSVLDRQSSVAGRNAFKSDTSWRRV